MVDQVSRSAARIAALVAVPVAALTGIGLYALLSGVAGDAGAPDPTSPPATGQAETGPVPAAERDLTRGQETVCRGLLARLPGELAGLAQRPVTAGPEQNAAYGEPPVALACGVPEVEYPPTDGLYLIVPAPAETGVCWYVAEHPDQTVWTTVDRDIPVRVTVPAGHDAPGQLVTALSGAILETVPPAPAAPTGCT